ncbi:MAG: SWIM zinc finger family protein [bacterium]
MRLHSLTREKILGLVGKTIFDRGVQYAQSGRVVDLLVESSGEISALVEGNDTYEVTISEENQQLKFHCDCPYEETCKHLVAVLLCYLEQPERSTRPSSRKGVQTQKSLRKLLEPLPQPVLLELVLDICQDNKDFANLLRLRLQPGDPQVLRTLLSRVRRVHLSFEDYEYDGYGRDLRRAVREFKEIQKLLKNVPVPNQFQVHWEIVLKILNAFEEYQMDHEGLEDVLIKSLAMISQIVTAEEQHPEFQRYFQLLGEKYRHLDGFLHDTLIDEIFAIIHTKEQILQTVDWVKSNVCAGSSQEDLLEQLQSMLSDLENPA